MIKNILLIMIFSTLLLADITRDNSENIIIDSSTNLQWQDNSDVNSTTLSWQGSIDYCEALILAEQNDWRLPNLNELLSIADKHKVTAPAINSQFKYVAYTPNDLTLNTTLYWSSTTSIDYSDKAYNVNFNYGDETDYFDQSKKVQTNYTRCVRGGI